MNRLILIIALFASIGVAAQTTYTVPLSETNGSTPIFNAVTTAQTSGCLKNEGQNIWFSNYSISGGTPAAIEYKLEYSFNSDAATCTTGTWFQMSDSATDLVQGSVIGIGSYPFVRANLVTCNSCSPATFTSWYSTSSANPGNLNGFYNPSQQVRKVIMQRQAQTVSLTVSGLPAPYGSTAGFLVVQTTQLFVGGSILVTCHVGGFAQLALSYAINTSAAGYAVAIPMPSNACTSIDVAYTTGGGAANRFLTVLYYFLPPGNALPYGAQPASAVVAGTTNPNQEATSAANSAVSLSLEVPNSSLVNAQRGNLFSVSARCSAGTAQLTVKDGGTSNSLTTGTTIWSSATTEVGTTTFKFQWNPGLSASPGNGILITLGTCGVANTGTLDVQGSVF